MPSREWRWGIFFGLALVLCPGLSGGSPVPPQPDAAEDLLRDHGLLRRVLFIYEDLARQLESGQDITPRLLKESAGTLRSFYEDYHEKLEQDFIFPRLSRDQKLAGLVGTLKKQQSAGRKLTDTLLGLDDIRRWDNARVAETLRQSASMYGRAAAREDTELYPAFRKLLTEDEYRDLGRQFENREMEMFGADGFEKTASKVSEIEKELGLYDLGGFTPSSSTSTPAKAAGSR